MEEAIGIAKAMAKTDLPYVISFTINREGRVLDGTALIDVVNRIDAIVSREPLGYMANCSYPTFLCADSQPTAFFKRLIGFQANASSLDHCELDAADSLKTEGVDEWGDAMLNLNRYFHTRILGGCCGTGTAHIRYIAENA